MFCASLSSKNRHENLDEKSRLNPSPGALLISPYRDIFTISLAYAEHPWRCKVYNVVGNLQV
ncbi:hypothetical protein B2M27_09735 [Kluyvera intermedia]|uniref:Uncharacterized protein n=1 Tax=Kluyvera intermedia TaxID=61648 RepID=A0ABX3UGG1_KLUIN|nr:hypothetical protein B2M27_09735 [Kluyvera intermedia]RDT53936.1 hypothetical protein DXF93_14880 [Escherichia coli]